MIAGAVVLLLACICAGGLFIGGLCALARAAGLADRALDFAEQALRDRQLDAARERHYQRIDAWTQAGDDVAENVFPLHPDRGADAEIVEFPGGAAA